MDPCGNEALLIGRAVDDLTDTRDREANWISKLTFPLIVPSSNRCIPKQTGRKRPPTHACVMTCAFLSRKSRLSPPSRVRMQNVGPLPDGRLLSQLHLVHDMETRVYNLNLWYHVNKSSKLRIICFCAICSVSWSGILLEQTVCSYYRLCLRIFLMTAKPPTIVIITGVGVGKYFLKLHTITETHHSHI